MALPHPLSPRANTASLVPILCLMLWIISSLLCIVVLDLGLYVVLVHIVILIPLLWGKYAHLKTRISAIEAVLEACEIQSALVALAINSPSVMLPKSSQSFPPSKSNQRPALPFSNSVKRLGIEKPDLRLPNTKILNLAPLLDRLTLLESITSAQTTTITLLCSKLDASLPPTLDKTTSPRNAKDTAQNSYQDELARFFGRAFRDSLSKQASVGMSGFMAFARERDYAGWPVAVMAMFKEMVVQENGAAQLNGLAQPMGCGVM